MKPARTAATEREKRPVYETCPLGDGWSWSPRFHNSEPDHPIKNHREKAARRAALASKEEAEGLKEGNTT